MAKKSLIDEKRIINNTRKKAPELIAGKARLGVIVRVCGDEGLSQATMDVFKRLRLDTPNQCVFLKITEPMLQLLTIVSPYVIWGFPSVKTVTDIIYKRGFTLSPTSGKKTSINNQLIEDYFTPKGINLICIEDLISELINLSANFVEINTFMLPIKLNHPPKKILDVFSNGRKISPEDWKVAGRFHNVDSILTKMV